MGDEKLNTVLFFGGLFLLMFPPVLLVIGSIYLVFSLGDCLFNGGKLTITEKGRREKEYK